MTNHYIISPLFIVNALILYVLIRFQLVIPTIRPAYIALVYSIASATLWLGGGLPVSVMFIARVLIAFVLAIIYFTMLARIELPHNNIMAMACGVFITFV